MLYEGGVRGISFVHSPVFKQTGHEYSGLVYITDWFRTSLHLAGLSHRVPDNVDSYDLWPSLTSGARKSGEREEIILNIDQDNRHNTWSAALM